MFKRTLTSAVAIAAMLLTTTVAKADFVIDTFTTPNPATAYSVGTTSGSTFSAVPSTIGAGVTRNITVTQTGNVFIATNGFFGNTGAVAGAAFQLNTSNSSTASAYAKLSYTYSSAQNLNTGGPVLLFSFDALQTAAPFSVVLSDGTTTATQTGLVAVGSSSTSFAIPLSSFSGTNLNAITSIDLFVNRNVTTNTSSPDADITLRDVRVSQDVTPPSVPAPPVAILLLAAAPALGLVRFGRRKIGM